MSLQTAKSLAGLMQSQWWDSSRLQTHQLQRLNHMMTVAAKSPFYKQLYETHHCPRTLQSLEDIKQLPVVHKADLQTAADNALNTTLNNNQMRFVNTGGSTGKVLRVAMDKSHQKRRVASIYRTLITYGYRPQHKLLYGQQYPGGAGFLEKLGLLRTYGLDLKDKPEQWLQTLLQEKPEFLSGHASIFSEIGLQLQQSNSNYQAQRIICNSEMLTPSRAQIIESAFGVKPLNVYDSWEFGNIAWQCPEQQGLHINTDLLFVEVMPDGQLLITDLYNEAMPLIRYAIGDSATVSSKQCCCGRSLPVLHDIIGKSLETVVLSDNSESACAHRLAASLYEAFPTIMELQIQQYEKGQLQILLQLKNWDDNKIQHIEQEFAQKFGLEKLQLRESNAFFETAAGKRPVFYSALKHKIKKAV